MTVSGGGAVAPSPVFSKGAVSHQLTPHSKTPSRQKAPIPRRQAREESNTATRRIQVVMTGNPRPRPRFSHSRLRQCERRYPYPGGTHRPS